MKNWCQFVKWIIHSCFLLGTLMVALLLESLICHHQYGEDTVNLNC